jgi:gas vesicle protein
MKTGKALLGVLVGLMAGAVLGLIFASDKEPGVSKESENFLTPLKNISTKNLMNSKARLKKSA